MQKIRKANGPSRDIQRRTVNRRTNGEGLLHKTPSDIHGSKIDNKIKYLDTPIHEKLILRWKNPCWGEETLFRALFAFTSHDRVMRSFKN